MATRKRSSKRSPPRPPRAPPSPPPIVDSRLVQGVALFNAREFFHYHDVLEQLWLATPARERSRDFYRGLIQAAIAFHHWSRKNQPGALTLYRSSSAYLKKYLPAWLGVDVAQFLAQYTELFQWLRRHRVPYDPRLAPTIRWVGGRAPHTL